MDFGSLGREAVAGRRQAQIVPHQIPQVGRILAVEHGEVGVQVGLTGGAARIRGRLDQPHHPMRQRAGFAGPRPGDDQERAGGGAVPNAELDGRPLLPIEHIQIGGRRDGRLGGGHPTSQPYSRFVRKPNSRTRARLGKRPGDTPVVFLSSEQTEQARGNQQDRQRPGINGQGDHDVLLSCDVSRVLSPPRLSAVVVGYSVDYKHDGPRRYPGRSRPCHL